MKTNWYEIKNQAGSAAEVFIFGDVVNSDWEKWDENDTTAKDLINAMKGMGDYTLRINSLGGSVPAGNAIYNAMRRHQGKITGVVEGMACSMASVILMACDRVVMPSNSMLMIHKPWGCMAGNADDLRDYADTLDKWETGLIAAYREKTGMDDKKIKQMMTDETWMTADEAVKLGFADEIEKPVKIAAKYDPQVLSRFRNTPKDLLPVQDRIPAATLKPVSLREFYQDPKNAEEIYRARAGK
jgi:ATP-dependent Clp endopeptidase proteolytic subunit ClpP